MVKCIVLTAMLLNHISQIFLTPGTLAAELLRGVGYCTAPTMCYFLVEGYHFTSSKKRYFMRLAVFALASQIPFCLAFTSNGILSLLPGNMMFSLSLCFLLCHLLAKVQDKALTIFGTALIVLASLFCDWSFMAPLFTVVFWYAYGSKKATLAAFLFCMAIFGSVKYAIAKNALFVVLYVFGVLLSMILVCFLYSEKESRAELSPHAKKLLHYGFYAFYPLHLVILGIFRIVLLGK